MKILRLKDNKLFNLLLNIYSLQTEEEYVNDGSAVMAFPLLFVSKDETIELKCYKKSEFRIVL